MRILRYQLYQPQKIKRNNQLNKTDKLEIVLLTVFSITVAGWAGISATKTLLPSSPSSEQKTITCKSPEEVAENLAAIPSSENVNWTPSETN